MIQNLIGRNDEIRRLDSCMRENRAQLIILYGRRRIGKTYLINEYFHGRFDDLPPHTRDFSRELGGHFTCRQ